MPEENLLVTEKPKRKAGNPNFAKRDFYGEKKKQVYAIRKKLTENKSEDSRLAFQKKVSRHWNKLIQGKLDLALGHFVQGKDGKIYKVSPDPMSSRYLIDQVIGKPMERQKLEADIDIELDI
jgi:hypothetical protein